MEGENLEAPDLGPEGLNTGDNAGPGNFKMPSVEELLEALEKMDGLTEENKQEIREGLANQAKGGVPDFLNQAKAGRAPPDLLLLFIFLTVILFVFVFFGYKLYRALTERDRRKEEKKRLKEQKKKKK